MTEWRTEKDPLIPNGKKSLKISKKTKAIKDPTYGSEPDLLDEPGLIVEPDVRQKISNYFKDMMLREWIRSLIQFEI